MTSPIPEVLSYTLKPASTGSGYMNRTDNAANFVALPPGVNTVIISWMGDSALTFNYRNPASLVTTLGVSMAESVGTRRPRTQTMQIPVPVESTGGRLHVSAVSATTWDVERVACGVQIINQSAQQ